MRGRKTEKQRAWLTASLATARRSLEQEKEAKGDGGAAQPLLAGTRHRSLDQELGVATGGALERLLGSDGKDPEAEVLQQLAVHYEHGERAAGSEDEGVGRVRVARPTVAAQSRAERDGVLTEASGRVATEAPCAMLPTPYLQFLRQIAELCSNR